jgi:hypothetical protein
MNCHKTENRLNGVANSLKVDKIKCWTVYVGRESYFGMYSLVDLITIAVPTIGVAKVIASSRLNYKRLHPLLRCMGSGQLEWSF